MNSIIIRFDKNISILSKNIISEFTDGSKIICFLLNVLEDIYIEIIDNKQKLDHWRLE